MPISRRKFIVAAMSGPLLLLAPVQQSQAFWPLLLRVFVGGAVRRTVVSSVARSAVGAAARSGASAAVRRTTMKSVSSLGVKAGLVVSVSPNVFALAEEHNAEAIWVQNGYHNSFSAQLANNSQENISSGDLYFSLEDVTHNTVEKEQYGGVLFASPGDQFRFSFEIAELPYPGVKRIVGRSTNPDIKCVPSGNIVVASSYDVQLEG